MKIHTIVRLLGTFLITAAMLLAAAGWVPVKSLKRLDAFLYDARLLATLPGTKSDKIIIIDIDEESLAEIGRWPWSRDKVADLVTKSFDEYGLGILGFDVIFAEPDSSSGLPVLDALAQGRLSQDQGFAATLQKIRPDLEYDRMFAEAIQGRAVVLGFAASDVPGTANALPFPVTFAMDPEVEKINMVVRQGVTGNLAMLQANAASAGFFDNALVDDDGLFRRLPLVYRHGDGVYETLTLAMLRLALGSPPLKFRFADEDADLLTGIGIGDLFIPTDANAAALVPYRGRYGSFEYIRAADILKGRADRSKMQGRFALVGSTAAGIMDLRATPVNNVFPGVEVHANILSGMLNDTFKTVPEYAPGFEFVMLLIIGILMALVLPRLGALWSVVAVIALVVVVASLNIVAWRYQNLSLPLASQLVLIALAFVFQILYAYFVEARNRRQLGKTFGQYVPPEIVDEMDTGGGEMSFALEGESRDMSVLFSDVRGFTTLSEGLEPQELTRLMNALLTPLTRVIHHRRGTIDKYMGDAIMAFWGAPLVDHEHANHAVEAGLAMIAQLPGINADFEKRGWPPVNIGVGVNTGVMNVGNMGSEFRMAYTVLGDAVNLGARLEGQTKEYGVLFIVSEYTVRQADAFVYRELDRIRVKGKTEPVTIYEPICRKTALSDQDRDRLQRYHNALALWRKRRWDEAEMNFASLAAQEPDRPLYQLYMQRAAQMRAADPGPNWDGVVTKTSK